MYDSFIWIWLLYFSMNSFATSGITYHGRLLKPDGAPVTSSNVQFKMQIRTPGTEDCLLYEEIQTLNLSASSGAFSVSVGDGTGTRADAHASDWSLFDSLSNRQTFNFSTGECSGSTVYTPNASDNRRFRVFFDDGSGTGWQSLPAQAINYIPMSIESYAVGGYKASSLFRVEDAGVLGNISALTTTQYNNLVSLADGTSLAYEKSGSLNGSTLPLMGSGESVRWSGTSWESYSPLASGDEADPTVETFAKTSLPTCASGEVLKSNGSVLSCVTDTSGTLPDVGTAGTYTKVTTDVKGRVTSGDTLDEADLPNITTAGKVSGDAITSGEISGSTSMNTSGNITTTGVIYGAALQTRRLHVYDDDTNFVTLKTPSNLSGDYALTLPVDGGTSGQVLSTDGSGTLSWISPSTGSVTSVTGTSPIVVGGTASAPVVSLDDTAVTPGSYGSATQVPVITVDSKGRITSASNTTISGVSPVGSTLSTGKAWLGDGSGKAQERFIGISDLRSSIAPGYTQFFPTTCTGSQTMTWQSITDTMICTGISITKSQVSDFPTLGTASAEDVGVGANNVVQLDGSGKLPALDGSQLTNLPIPNYDTTYFKQDGNSFGGAATVGANDNNPLHLETNNAIRMTITSVGNVGIGTTTPSSKLDVLGTIQIANGGETCSVAADGGMIRYNGGNLQFCNESSWQTLGVSGSGLTSLNGLTGSSQSFATPTTSGTSLSWSSASNAHTLNIPMASNTGVTAGLLSKADYDAFNSKLSAVAGSSLSSASIWVGDASNHAQVVGMSGDATLSSDGTLTLKNTGTASTYGSATKIPIITTDAQGRVTNVTESTITIPQDASGLTNTPAGNIAATTVQAAMNELDSEKVAKAGDTMTGTLNLSSDGLVVGGSQLVVNGGNVGIGTNGADYLLDVQSINENTIGRITARDTLGNGYSPVFKIELYDPATGGGTPTLEFQNSRGSSSAPAPTMPYSMLGKIDFRGVNLSGVSESWASIVAETTGNLNSATDKETRIRFSTNDGASSVPTERMRITHDGNVGIGTVSPETKLQVYNGSVAVTNSDNWNSLFLYTASDDKNGTFQIMRSRGTTSSPTYPISGDVLGDIKFMNWSAGDGATIQGITTQSHSASVGGSALAFRTIPNDAISSVEAMRIDQNGNVGIGTTAPSQKLQVGESGDGSVAVANAWNTFSDIRLKKNITPIKNACQMVRQLNGYYYNWKYGKDQSRQVGVIAQEVREVLPELVNEGPDRILTVDYPKLSAVLIEAIKEVDRKNQDVTRELSSLKKENQTIKEVLCEINPRSKLCKVLY